ncbi:S-adenosyl-L-methionine-dependent methyltransferase [Lophiotrema nucula]|uniref:phosphoethanolamine N-methyltransferase n=1 Tax=Lophiotrema nucula TaxID=690887 RepID=A0A6A5YWQ7_9PLEO|nr:S-adenosyl-L-methionine-dependent methyltransferase [Lophiotrema nucula]
MVYTSSSKFYDSLGMRYEKAYGHCLDHIEFVKKALEMLSPGASVLDTGCGTGKPTASMVINSGRQLHGIDFSPVMISICHQQVPGGTFEQADMLDWVALVPFDAAISTFALLNFPHAQMSSIIANHYDWIKPNGYFFIGTLLPDNMTPDPDPVDATANGDANAPNRYRSLFMGSEATIYLYNEQGWEALLKKAGFEVLETSTARFDPPKESGSGTEIHYYIVAQRAA